MAKLLLIDDDEKIISQLKRYLEKIGHTVEPAANGRDGIEMLDGWTPDLVITDIMMPEADGLEVVMAIRKNYPDIPVFAISGGMHAVPMDFLPVVKKLGAKKVFYKPVELEKLAAAIDEELGG
ncbi:response regulator transcription factor [Pontiella sp.]|uniref:response regulator transcription factor n=1 Tax=Pontiella sp. TaxID=2837462 RepID=UPI00356A15DD